MADSHVRGHLDHHRGEIAAPRDHELHVLHHVEHPLRGLHEVFGALLHRDATEEQDDLVLGGDGLHALRHRIEFHAVVDHVDLRGRYPVPGDAQVLGQLAHRDDLHGPVHAASFDVVDRLVHVFAGAVEFRGVDVDDQRLSGEPRDRESGGIGEPVVCVDDVEFGALRDFEAESCVGVRLADQIAAVVGRVGLPRRHGRLLRIAIGNRGPQRHRLRDHFGIAEATGLDDRLDPPVVDLVFLEDPSPGPLLFAIDGLHLEGQVYESGVAEPSPDLANDLDQSCLR